MFAPDSLPRALVFPDPCNKKKHNSGAFQPEVSGAGSWAASPPRLPAPALPTGSPSRAMLEVLSPNAAAQHGLS